MADKDKDEEMIKKGKEIVTDLRKKEEKKGIFSGLFKKKEEEKKENEKDVLKGFGSDADVITEVTTSEETAPLVEEKEPSLREIIAKIDRIDGKISAEREIRSNMETRMLEVSERVGELRTTVIERDKAFRNIEEEFGKFKVLIETVQPQEIRKELNKREIDVLSNKAKVEVLTDQLGALKTNVEKINSLTENIKSFENLSQILKDIDRKISIISTTKKEVDMSAGKIEAVFLELNSRILEFEKRKNQIDFMDEVLKESMKNIDRIGLKVENVAKKDDILSELKHYVTKEEISTLKQYISPDEIKKLREGVKNLDELLGKQKLMEKNTDELRSKINKSNDSANDFYSEFESFKKNEDKKFKKFEDTLSEYDAIIESVKKINLKELKDIGTRIDFIESNIKDIKKRLSEIEFEEKGGESKEDKGLDKKIKKMFHVD